MHFSDSTILRASSSMVFCVLPTLSWPTVKRAISSCFSIARFFLSCARCQAILLLLSAIAMLLIRFDHITAALSRESDGVLRGRQFPCQRFGRRIVAEDGRRGAPRETLKRNAMVARHSCWSRRAAIGAALGGTAGAL